MGFVIVTIAVGLYFWTAWLRSLPWVDRLGSAIELSIARRRIGTADEQPNDVLASAIQFAGACGTHRHHHRHLHGQARSGLMEWLQSLLLALSIGAASPDGQLPELPTKAPKAPVVAVANALRFRAVHARPKDAVARRGVGRA